MIANMELCAARGISSVPSVQPKLLAPNRIRSFQCRAQFPASLKQTRLNSVGLRSRSNTSLRSTTSEETSTERTPYDAGEPEPEPEPEPEAEILVENKEDFDTQLNEAPQDGSLVDNLQFLKFLEEYDIKFDYEDASSYLVFGGGGAVALWLAAAIVGAIDSIPLVPKVLELVGLGYTIWFSTRYLIFKENRDELFATVDQIKQQVLGSKDN